MKQIVFRVNCPACGKVAVAADSMLLCITFRESSYAFTCPECAVIVERATSARVLNMLIETLAYGRPPITELDIREFAEALDATPDPIAELGD